MIKVHIMITPIFDDAFFDFSQIFQRKKNEYFRPKTLKNNF